MGYRIGTRTRGRQSVLTLHDDSTGAEAAILPSYGFNLFDLRLPAAGQVRPIIDAAADFAENPRGGAGNGTPILFPYPNRVGGAAFTFTGRTYKLPANNGPNSIHGFAVDAPWDVVEHKADADAAYVVGRYQISRHSPRMVENWPTDAVLQVRYSLSGRKLTMAVTVSNPTASDLPYGFGIHPYFRLPFPPGGDPGRTRVILPASQAWVLKDFLPTGEIRPVDARLDFRSGRPIAGLKLDDVLTGLTYEGGRGVCRLVDEEKRAEFRLGFDRAFRELVVYTPPPRPQVISLEPYTQTTDAINLAARGVDAGLRILGHGAQDLFEITMETVG
jgi:aldose 1-epimerase